jgi:hypothetical protein
MHSRLTTRAVAAAAAVAVALALCVPIVVVAVAGPSAAQGRGPGGSCAQCQGSVTPVDEGFLARVRSDSTTLNSAAANPQACMGVGRDPRLDENNNPIPEPGILRWRTTALGEESWDELPEGTEAGTWYRLECWDPSWEFEGGFGDLVDVREFQVAPPALAALAIDDALARIGVHNLSTSPASPSLVGLDTWYWATLGDGTPIGTVTESASVPGTTVTVTASPSNLRIDPGDGSPVIDCAGRGTPYAPGASSDCTTDYHRAGNYTVTSTLLWSGTYTINGGGNFTVDTPVARTFALPLTVQEAQAINT